MFYKLRTLLIIFFLIKLSSACLSEAINKIDIEGNIRLDDRTIFSYLNITKNSRISKSDLNTMFKDLFSTELFSEIKFLFLFCQKYLFNSLIQFSLTLAIVNA